MIKIALAEDHELFAEMMAEVLSQEPNFEMVITASNGRELLQKMEQTPVDVILLDLSMPEMDGVEALKVIRERFSPAIKVIMLSMHYEESFIRKLLLSGANAYLAKECDYDILVAGIEEVHDCGIFFQEELSDALVEDMLHNANTSFHAHEGDPLSTSETNIVKLLGKGLATPDIARLLNRSKRTIENHQFRIMQKLGFERGKELAQYAIQHSGGKI